MARLDQIRGALLEEVILFLLSKSGFEILKNGEPGTRLGRAGQELQGRGCWHQIDAVAVPRYSPPFMYPVRLLVEAKCYAKHRPVQVNVVRSVLGWLVDISQNYFTEHIDGGDIKFSRFNYAAAVFSTSGYSDAAQQYALAHQIFLIDYAHVPLMRPVAESLFRLALADFRQATDQAIDVEMNPFRGAFRGFLQDAADHQLEDFFTVAGLEKLRREMVPAILGITASYHGMVQGVYPVHLLAARPIPAALLRANKNIRCAIRVSDDGLVWAFEPAGVNPQHERFFRLEFQLPTRIAETIDLRRVDWMELAHLKQQYLSYVDVSGIVEGEFMTFRLSLDEEWLQNYVNRRRLREPAG
jgi:Restriction endonuclease